MAQAQTVPDVLPYYQDRLQNTSSSPRVLELRRRDRNRPAMTGAERLLSDLLEGSLEANDYSRVMPFHCIDARYKKCPSFMHCFYPLGLGGFAPGPAVSAFGDAVATLCYLTGKDHSIADGLPIAVVIGEHEDCGFSKMETKVEDPEIIEAHTTERTNSHMLRFLKRSDIEPAISSGRLVVVLTKSFFVREADGGYSLLYQVMPWRTNQLLEAAGRNQLSREFSAKFGGRLLVFGRRAARIAAKA